MTAALNQEVESVFIYLLQSLEVCVRAWRVCVCVCVCARVCACMCMSECVFLCVHVCACVCV